MKTEFTVGRILRTRGLKGVVKAEAYSENAARLTSLSRMRVGGREYAVEDMSAEAEFLYIKLAGVDTPEAAEALRGKELKVLRADLPAPPEGRHYIADLLGSDVIVDGDRIGELTDILQYGSADVYVVRTAEGSVSFPAIKELIRDIDSEKGVITLDGRIFARTAVFNK